MLQPKTVRYSRVKEHSLRALLWENCASKKRLQDSKLRRISWMLIIFPISGRQKAQTKYSHLSVFWKLREQKAQFGFKTKLRKRQSALAATQSERDTHSVDRHLLQSTGDRAVDRWCCAKEGSKIHIRINKAILVQKFDTSLVDWDAELTTSRYLNQNLVWQLWEKRKNRICKHTLARSVRIKPREKLRVIHNFTGPSKQFLVTVVLPIIDAIAWRPLGWVSNTWESARQAPQMRVIAPACKMVPGETWRQKICKALWTALLLRVYAQEDLTGLKQAFIARCSLVFNSNRLSPSLCKRLRLFLRRELRKHIPYPSECDQLYPDFLGVDMRSCTGATST